MTRVENISNSKDIKMRPSVSKPNNELVFFEYNNYNYNNVSNRNKNAINPIAQNLVTLTNDKGFFTRKLSDIEDIVNNQIDDTNICEIMADYTDKKGRSLIADICSYKCASNNKRKSIILNLIDKLEKANKSGNTEISLLASSLRGEVEYQFDKWGFIDTTYITSMFEALLFKTQCLPAITDYKSLEDIEKEFSIESFNTNYKKEEGIGKIKTLDEKGKPHEILIDKVVTFTFDNGEKLVENYSYDKKNKEFVLYEKVLYNNDQKVKSISYFPDGNIAQVHRYSSEDASESYYYRNDGTIYQHFIYTKEKAQHLTFGMNGELASCENFPR